MADEDAEAIIQGAKAIKDCEEQINFILAEVEKIRLSLRNLREDVEGFQKYCNVAKTVGTTSGVAGAGLAIGILKQPSFYLAKFKRIQVLLHESFSIYFSNNQVGCVGAFFTLYWWSFLIAHCWFFGCHRNRSGCQCNHQCNRQKGDQKMYREHQSFGF